MGLEDDKQREHKQDLPPVGRAVWVFHLGRERVAYLDGQGLWRDYGNGDLLAGDVRFIGPLETRE